jgi:hypothetical protein
VYMVQGIVGKGSLEIHVTTCMYKYVFGRLVV